jgi:hypothetical protein
MPRQVHSPVDRMLPTERSDGDGEDERQVEGGNRRDAPGTNGRIKSSSLIWDRGNGPLLLVSELLDSR